MEESKTWITSQTQSSNSKLSYELSDPEPTTLTQTQEAGLLVPDPPVFTNKPTCLVPEQ